MSEASPPSLRPPSGTWLVAIGALGLVFAAGGGGLAHHLGQPADLSWGVAFGAALGVGNFLVLVSLLARMLRPRAASRWGIIWAGKLAVLIALLYVAVEVVQVSPLGLALGVTLSLPLVLAGGILASRGLPPDEEA